MQKHPYHPGEELQTALPLRPFQDSNGVLGQPTCTNSHLRLKAMFKTRDPVAFGVPRVATTKPPGQSLPGPFCGLRMELLQRGLAKQGRTKQSQPLNQADHMTTRFTEQKRHRGLFSPFGR